MLVFSLTINMTNKIHSLHKEAETNPSLTALKKVVGWWLLGSPSGKSWVLIVLIIISLLICCIIPILRKVLMRAVVKQMSLVAVTKVTEFQLAEMVINQPDIFPIIDYMAGCSPSCAMVG